MNYGTEALFDQIKASYNISTLVISQQFQVSFDVIKSKGGLLDCVIWLGA